MNKTRFFLVGLAALLMLPTGCTKQPVASGLNEEVGVSLALSVGGTQQRGTKMSESVTQYAFDPTSFRGIDQVFILPFRSGGTTPPVADGDKLWDYRLALPQLGLDGSFMGDSYDNAGLVYNNYAHLYDRVYLRPDTDAVLVYGKAQDESANTAGDIAFLQHNGSLIAPDFDKIENTSEILFSPDPISSNVNTSPKNASVKWRDDLIQYYLNIILKAKASRSGTPTYSFNMPASYNNHPGLVAALENFTNKGLYFPLSAELLSYKLTQLYQALYPLATDASLSEDYYYLPKNGPAFPYVYELAKSIIKEIFDDTKTNDQNKYATRSYNGKYSISLKTNGPIVYGLPAGTYAIQWQEGGTSTNNRVFKNLYNIDGTGHFDGLGYIPSDEFCYPPSLWYYINSPLISTDQEGIERYTSSDTWEAIQSNYTNAGVGSLAKAAAIRDPLQYGVALLELKCQKASSNNLEDFAPKNINVNNTNFPLTGIIVADQYPQRYDFTATTDANAEMSYLYDAEVNGSDGKARAWISKNTASSVLTTLVLPTRPGKDVRFALEFLNNTNTTIVGANGCNIAPKQHFYLAGILKFSERTDNSGDNLGSVFVRGYVTEVKASFTSLKAAYDVIPDLTEPQLQLGVQAEFGWNLSTPTNVPIVIQ